MKEDLPPSFVDGETEAYPVPGGACSRSYSISVNKWRLKLPAQEKQKRKLETILTEMFAVLSLGKLGSSDFFFFFLTFSLSFYN